MKVPEIITNIPEEVQVAVISMIPVFEQRASIPIGILGYDMNPLLVFAIAFFASLIPSPFIILFFNRLYEFLERYKIFKPIYKFLENKINKNSKKIELYKEIGLILFVAIPLPTTGVWTGSLLTAVFRLERKKAFLCIMIGAFISATVITLVCLFIPGLFESAVDKIK
jgi:uncharacterized membrane protein